MTAERQDPFAPWKSGETGGIEGKRRGFRRWAVHVRATLRAGRRRRICVANDLSPGGAAVTLFRALDVALGDAVSLFLPGFGIIPAEVRHVDGHRLGLMFTHDEARSMALARYLIEQPPPRGDGRVEVGAPAQLIARGQTHACRLANISRFGAGIAFAEAEELQLEEEVLLRVPGVGSLEASVARIGKGQLGLVLIDEYVGGIEGAPA